MLNGSPQPVINYRRSLAVLALIVGFSFGLSLAGGFVWIDHAEILAGGYRVTSASQWGPLWTESLDQWVQSNDRIAPTRGGYWRPLYALDLTLDWAIWRDTAWLYHAENLAWHYLVVIGLFLLGVRLLEGAGFRRPDRAAFWAAALFAAHPLGVHSVVWISGRKDLMCAAFATGCLLAFARACDADGRRDRRFWMALALLSLLAATLCKELALVTPLAAALLLVPVQQEDRPRWSRNLGLYAGLWLVVGLVVLYRLSVLGGFGLNAQPASDSTLINASVSSRLIWHYLGRVVWPLFPSISDAWIVPGSLGWLDWVALGAILGLIGLTVYLLIKRQVFSLGLIWFAIWILPASGVVPLRHLRAERYLYPASWGVCLLVVILVFQWSNRQARRYLLVTMVAVLAGISAWECRYWFSDQALFERSVQLDPSHLEGRLGLANQRLNLGLDPGDEADREGPWKFNQDDARAALEQVESVLQQAADPQLKAFWPPFETYTYQGLASFYLGELEQAESAFETALTYRPGSGVGNYHLGLVAMKRGDYSRAIELMQKALSVQPNDFLTRSNLAACRLGQQQLEPAAQLLGPLVEERPGNRLNRLNYGNCLLAQKDFSGAKPHFAWLAKGDPGNAMVQSKLAWCDFMTGNRDEAWKRLEQVLNDQPGHPTALSIHNLLRQKQRESNERGGR